MAEGETSLQTALAAIGGLRGVTEASLRKSDEILTQVMAVKEKVGEHAISLGQLQRDHQYHAQAIAGLERQNEAQEGRLRMVEQRPEKPRVIEEELKAIEGKLAATKDELVEAISDMANQIAKARVWQQIISWGINLVAAAGAAAAFEWITHHGH